MSVSSLDCAHLDALRAHIETHGVPVVIDPDADYPEDEVSPYGWADYHPLVHASDPAKVHDGQGCRWVLPAGATVTQRAYLLYDGPNRERVEAGFNASPARCACGDYSDVTLRVATSLGEVLVGIFTADTGELAL